MAGLQEMASDSSQAGALRHIARENLKGCGLSSQSPELC